jgi:tetrahydromethanopterin S-methyltransferase subunit F
MRNDRSTPAAGTRSTRLGLVALGFVVGVLVTVLVLFMFNLR